MCVCSWERCVCPNVLVEKGMFISGNILGALEEKKKKEADLNMIQGMVYPSHVYIFHLMGVCVRVCMYVYVCEKTIFFVIVFFFLGGVWGGGGGE